MTISFVVFGNAVPMIEKSHGRMPGIYTDKRTLDWKAVFAEQAVAYRPETLLTGAIHLTVEVVLPRPGYLMLPKYYWRCRSRKCGWKGAEGETCAYGCPLCGGQAIEPVATPPHIKKPDLTAKLLRPIEDALTGIVWHDDRQINGGTQSKRFAEIGEAPHVSVRIEEAS